jgi:hypothetical protein
MSPIRDWLDGDHQLAPVTAPESSTTIRRSYPHRDRSIRELERWLEESAVRVVDV